MQLYDIVMVIVGIAFNILVNTQTVLGSLSTCECFHLGYVHQCEASTYKRGVAKVFFSCGGNSCAAAGGNMHTKWHGVYHFNIPDYQFGTDEANRISEQIMMLCSTIANAPDSSHWEECYSAFLDLTELHRCCFQTVFNEQLPQIILGHDIDIFINACNITAQPLVTSQFQAMLTIVLIWSSGHELSTRSVVHQLFNHI